MEDLNINKFLEIEKDYGYGYVFYDSYDFGSGYNSGYCYGSVYNSGSGSDYDFGYGSDFDYGYCSDNGSDYGIYGKIVSLNNKKIYLIDNKMTIINAVRGNIAKCEIVNTDLSTTPCYVAKVGNYFAHGETLKQAVEDARDKMFEYMPTEEKIQEFIKVFDKDKKYKGTEFFEWHNKLTGSCLMGREHFVKNGGYDLDDEYTVKEFIKICENDFGGDIIKQLKEYYYERNRI